MTKQIIIDGKVVKGIECKHATLIVPKDPDHDIHYVKERIHFEDGSWKSNIRLMKDFKRPFYVTKQSHRNHKDKKEFERRELVDAFKCPEYMLQTRLRQALGEYDKRKSVRDLSGSPYVYGTDQMSTTHVKKFYHESFGPIFTPFTIGVADTETDMVEGTGEIMMMTHSCKEQVYTAIQKRFFKGHVDVINRLKACLMEYLGEEVKARGIQWEVELVDSEIDVVKGAFAHAHKVQPDFMVYWNMDFDIGKILEACGRAKVDPKDIFCDPSLPDEYKKFFYKQGKDKRITESGVVKTIEPADNWHTVFAPASFYVVDAMCIYRRVRIAKGKEKYGLDAVLQKNLKRRKLKFKATDHLSGARWHVEMQTNHKFEYVIYNVFDCIGIELLDEKTNDVCINMPSQCGVSDLSLFPSQPRRLCDEIAVELEKEGLVWGSTGPNMYVDFDEETISNGVGKDGLGWITTLEATLVEALGRPLLRGLSQLITNIRCFVGDLDVSGAYPHNQVVLNISKYTCTKELLEILGISERTRRMQGINLSGGRVNAVEFCTEMLSLPTLPNLLRDYEAMKANQQPNIVH